jgi:hypothetical protein
MYDETVGVLMLPVARTPLSTDIVKSSKKGIEIFHMYVPSRCTITDITLFVIQLLLVYICLSILIPIKSKIR